MWPFKSKRVAMQFDPTLLDLGKDPSPFRVQTDMEAMNALLYSQAVSMKRIADSLDRIDVYNTLESLKSAIEMGIWNATKRN